MVRSCTPVALPMNLNKPSHMPDSKEPGKQATITTGMLVPALTRIKLHSSPEILAASLHGLMGLGLRLLCFTCM